MGVFAGAAAARRWRWYSVNDAAKAASKAAANNQL